MAHFVARERSPILILMATEADCRDYMVSDIDPLILDSPALRDHLPMPHPVRSDRNTLLHRPFPDGSLKVVAGKTPRNLRHHTAHVPLIDEGDAIEASAEGDPVSLAEKRTLSFANRKIIAGSTPLDEATSHIARLDYRTKRGTLENTIERSDIAILKAILTWGANHGWIETNPIAGRIDFRGRREPKVPDKFYSDGEAASILRASLNVDTPERETPTRVAAN